MIKTLIYCDGGALNNQDPEKREGYGSFLVTKEACPNHMDGLVTRQNFLYGIGVTNNVAEYKTLLKALDYCVNEFIAEATIFMDSELVVEQVHGTFKTKDVHLKPLMEQAVKDIELIGAKLEKIPREIMVAVLGH